MLPIRSAERTMLPSRLGRLKLGIALRSWTAIRPAGAVLWTLLLCILQLVLSTPSDPVTRNRLRFIYVLRDSYRFVSFGSVRSADYNET